MLPARSGAREARRWASNTWEGKVAAAHRAGSVQLGQLTEVCWGIGAIEVRGEKWYASGRGHRVKSREHRSGADSPVEHYSMS